MLLTIPIHVWLAQLSLTVSSLKNLGLITITIAIVYVLFFFVARLWFRKIDSDAGLVTLKVSQPPAILISILIILKVFLGEPTNLVLRIIQETLSAVIILAFTFLVARVLSQVVFYYLRQYAEKTEAEWDDILIPILETASPIVVYSIGIFFALQSLELDLTGLWVAFGGITFVIGFALQDILANFFSGLVLLIDTPFRFGDVIAWRSGDRAVIKKVGLRMTQLYLLEEHCESYVPNAQFLATSILNLSRPSANYYYTIQMQLGSAADPARTIAILEAVALAHPDTLGNIDQKLLLIDEYFGAGISADERVYRKREAGRQRLLAEQQVNTILAQVEEGFDALTVSISSMEEGGLDSGEIRMIQNEYLRICQLVGLDVVTDDRNRKKSRLEEAKAAPGEDSLIGLLRQWYQVWLKDPDLLQEDHKFLPKEWEQKITLLKSKLNTLFRKLNEPSTDDTRLDDAVNELFQWIQERFKTTRNEWQNPRIWVSQIVSGYQAMMQNEFSIRFHVDDITLEHFQRGYRVESEINQEMVWHLRKDYLLR